MMQTVLRMMSYLTTQAISGNKISPVLLAGPLRGTTPLTPHSAVCVVLCVFQLWQPKAVGKNQVFLVSYCLSARVIGANFIDSLWMLIPSSLSVKIYTWLYSCIQKYLHDIFVFFSRIHRRSSVTSPYRASMSSFNASLMKGRIDQRYLS